jgi:hypothetical protein
MVEGPIMLFPTLPSSVPAESDLEQNHDAIVAGLNALANQEHQPDVLR